MAKHRHWFFVPAFDDKDPSFAMLKNPTYLPQKKEDAMWDKLRLIINAGEGNCESFDGIESDDRVYIYGHSNGTQLGSKGIKYEATKILNLLETFGLKPDKTSTTPRVFKLFGCTTGTVIGDSEETFAKRFFDLAKVRYGKVVVYGYVGFLRLGKSASNNKVFEAMYKVDGKWMLNMQTGSKARDMRVGYSTEDQSLEHQNTAWVLNQGEGWAMVEKVEST
jgi:hypothetical protein